MSLSRDSIQFACVKTDIIDYSAITQCKQIPISYNKKSARLKRSKIRSGIKPK